MNLSHRIYKICISSMYRSIARRLAKHTCTVKSPPPVARKPCNFRNPCVTGTKSISRECTWSREFCKVSNPCVTGTNSEIARPVGGTLLYIYTSRAGSTLGSGRAAILHGSGRVKPRVGSNLGSGRDVVSVFRTGWGLVSRLAFCVIQPSFCKV